MFGAPTAAQVDAPLAELVSVDDASQPLAGIHQQPSVSDDGNVVVFSTNTDTDNGAAVTYDLVVRNRSDDAPGTHALGLASTAPVAGAVSADGCTVAYSTLTPGQTDTVDLHLLDVCGEAMTDTVIARHAADAPLHSPAVTADGSTIVWPAEASVLVVDAASTPDNPDLFEIEPVDPSHLVGDHLDVAADGSVVVFEAGPDVADPDSPDADQPTLDTKVYLATIEYSPDDPDTPAIEVELFGSRTAMSWWPTISADGSIVAYQFEHVGDDGEAAAGDYIVVAERSADNPIRRVVTSNGARPDLSADGLTIVYDEADAVQILRSTSTQPYFASDQAIVNPRLGDADPQGAGASLTGAVVSGDGGVVVFDQPAGAALSEPTLPGQHVWAQDTDQLFETAPPTSSTTTSSTTTVLATTTTISPGGTTGASTTTGGTTDNATTTSTGGSTGSTSSTGGSTGSTSSTSGSTTSTGSSTSSTGGTTSSTGSSTSSTTGSTGSTSTSGGSGSSGRVGFEVSTFEFAPTIVGAGRRSAEFELVNSTADTVTITQVGLTGNVDDFTIEASECDTLGAGQRCTITVEFAPLSVGDIAGAIAVEVSDGTTAGVGLTGVSAPPPVLDVVPAVAVNGQVVAVIGSGFPASSSIDLVWNGTHLDQAVPTDENGGFVITKVVLPHTLPGPLDLMVAGQTDLFDNVTTTLIIDDSASRDDAAVFRSNPLGSGRTPRSR